MVSLWYKGNLIIKDDEYYDSNYLHNFETDKGNLWFRLKYLYKGTKVFERFVYAK